MYAYSERKPEIPQPPPSPLFYIKKKQTDNKAIGTTGFSVLTYFRKDAKTEKIAAIKFYATFKTRHYPKYRVVKCLSITFKNSPILQNISFNKFFFIRKDR